MKLLCMHNRQKTLFNDYDTRVEHRKKGKHVTFPTILLSFFRDNIVLTHKNLLLFEQGTMSTIKPATHLAILYADRGDRRIKSPISSMSDIGD